MLLSKATQTPGDDPSKSTSESDPATSSASIRGAGRRSTVGSADGETGSGWPPHAATTDAATAPINTKMDTLRRTTPLYALCDGTPFSREKLMGGRGSSSEIRPTPRLIATHLMLGVAGNRAWA